MIEEKNLKLIQDIYPDAYMVEGYCKEWDIYIPSRSMGIEIKYDKMSQKTGNIVVEIEFNGKPSALSTTKSKYWFFDIDVKTLVVETDTLKKMVKSLRVSTFTAKGDSKEKKAYLIKQKMIEDIAIPMESIKDTGGLDSFI